MTGSKFLAFFGGAPGTPELLMILVAVLILFGAKRLPEIARSLGKSIEEFKRAARDVTDEIMHADTSRPSPPKPLPSLQAEARPASASREEAEPEGVTEESAAEDDADAGPR